MDGLCAVVTADLERAAAFAMVPELNGNYDCSKIVVASALR
jgi:hypothetical protein